MMQEKDREEVEEQPQETEAAGQEDAQSLKKALEEERAKAEGYFASLQRAQADFINYKRRIEQEREDFARSSNAALILSLLPVLDDLQMAIAAAPQRREKHSWLEGIRMVERKLQTALELYGVKPIEAVGKPFDPNYHEAVRQDRGEDGMVVEEMRKGYMLNDKVLRPSMVVVGNGEGEKEEEQNG
jgi:molecular chaperone GrpE